MQSPTEQTKPQENTPNNNSIDQCKKKRIKSNWKKVRSMMKKISKNELVEYGKNLQNKIKLKIITKIESKLSVQQYQKFLQSLNQMSDPCCTVTLAINSQIIETINNFNSEDSQQPYIQIRTFKPLPRANYLAKQQTGEGMIDSTGAWVWEAQEILAYYLMVEFEKYPAWKVLQIGSGCSGLAALAYCKIWQTKMLNNCPINNKQNTNQLCQQQTSTLHLDCRITDGKNENIIFLHKNIEQLYTNIQQKNRQKIKIKGQNYLWGNKILDKNQGKQLQVELQQIHDKSDQFGLILAADCLFFQSYHQNIITTLNCYLQEQTGVALFVNPVRGRSLNNFIDLLNHENNKQTSSFIYTTKFIEFTDKKYINASLAQKSNQSYNKDTDELIFLQVQKHAKKNESPTLAKIPWKKCLVSYQEKTLKT